jgi:hypothetical protein
MEAYLATLHRLGTEQRAGPEYLGQLREAMIALDQSTDIPSFLGRLRGESVAPPSSSKLKNLLWFIIGIPALLVLASLNDIVTAVTPRWFQCLWGLC